MKPFFLFLLFGSHLISQVGFLFAESSLSLSDCISITVKNNSLMNLEEKKIESEKLKIGSYDAEKHPLVDLTSSYKNANMVGTFDAALDMTIDLDPILNKGRTNLQYSVAGAKAGKSEQTASLVLDVKNAYFGLMRKQDELDSVIKAIKILVKNREITRNFINSGIRNPSAVYILENRLNMLQADKLQIESGLIQSKNKLLDLMNMSSNIQVEISRYEKILPDLPTKKSIITNVEENSPYLARISSLLNAALPVEASSGRNFIPAVTFGLGYNQEIYPFKNPSPDFHISAAIQVFDGGRHSYRSALSRNLYEQEEIKAERNRSALLKEVNSYYDKTLTQQNLFYVFQKISKNTQKMLAETETEYKAGILDEITLLDTQEKAIEIESRITSAFYGYMQAYSMLEYFTGAVK